MRQTIQKFYQYELLRLVSTLVGNDFFFFVYVNTIYVYSVTNINYAFVFIENRYRVFTLVIIATVSMLSHSISKLTLSPSLRCTRIQ